MGTVIEKTVQILKLVASQEHCTLKSLCQVTGYKKSALCQMLRSMTETNLLLRDHRSPFQRPYRNKRRHAPAAEAY